MVQLTRRQLLQATLYSFILSDSVFASTVPDTRHGPDDLSATLKSILDRILPADQYSGSASELGIDTQLIKELDRNLNLKKLFIQGSRWINKQSGGSFAALPEIYQDELLTWLDEKASDQKIPGLFFRRLRYQAVELYYSSSIGSRDVGMLSPPQPVGYPEFLQNRDRS